MARPLIRPSEGPFSRAEIQARYRLRLKAEAIKAALKAGEVPKPVRRGRPPKHATINVSRRRDTSGSNPAQPPAPPPPKVLYQPKPPPAAATLAISPIITNGNNADPVHLAAAPRLSAFVREVQFREFTVSKENRDHIIAVLIATAGKTMTPAEIGILCEINKMALWRCLGFLDAQGLARLGDDDRVMPIPDALAEYNHRLSHKGAASPV